MTVPLSMLTYAEIFAASPGLGRFVVASNAKTESFCPAVFLRMPHPQKQPIEITHQPGGPDEPKRNIISDARAPVSSNTVHIGHHRKPAHILVTLKDRRPEVLMQRCSFDRSLNDRREKSLPAEMRSARVRRVGRPRLVLKQAHLVPASINSSFRSKGVQASQFGCPHVTCIQKVQNPLRIPLPLMTANTPLQ